MTATGAIAPDERERALGRERTRRYRARQRKCEAVFRITLGEDALSELIAYGVLSEAESADDERIAEAVPKYLTQRWFERQRLGTQSPIPFSVIRSR